MVERLAPLLRKGNTMAIQTNAQLNFKRVASYFKRAGLTVYIERLDNGEFLLTDRLTMVRVSMAHPDLAPYTDFDSAWKRASFMDSKSAAMEAQNPDQQQFWNQLERSEWHPLTLTHDLHEVPSSKKGGILWRKFTFEDTQLVQRQSYFNKTILDMFSSDLDELAEFSFEQIGHYGPMRVSASFGPIAIVMPGHNIESK